MEVKYLSRKKWKRILERKYVHEYIEDGDFKGEIALIHLINVASPRSSCFDGVEVTWIDQGYYWLELAPVNQNYWLTVMFNEQGEIQQYYFDITDHNVIDEQGDSYFYDLYLDIVVSNDKIYVLDEDELMEAYKKGIIDNLQVQKAIRTKDECCTYLNQHLYELKGRCLKYFKILKEKI